MSFNSWFAGANTMLGILGLLSVFGLIFEEPILMLVYINLPIGIILTIMEVMKR